MQRVDQFLDDRLRIELSWTVDSVAVYYVFLVKPAKSVHEILAK